VLEAAAVCHQTRIPFVVSTHYHPADHREPALKRGLLRIQDHVFGMTAYRGASALVVETEFEARLVREFAPGSRIRVIPPGVDLAGWERAETEPRIDGLPESYLLYAGRIASNKGLPSLFRALGLLRPQSRPTLVLLGPDWGERGRLDALAKELDLQASIRWMGHVESMPAYRSVFRRARAFVLPSEWEAFGLVLLDAMAAGVPVVATAVGGVPEVLEQGRCGVLVPYDDPRAIAQAVERVWTDPAERDRLIGCGRERVRDLDWSRAVERHLALYREIQN
jgi:starch synthase